MARQPPASARSRPSTASADEMARFAAIAGQWWDPDGKFRPLHRFNPRRLEYIRDRTAAHFGRDPRAGRPLAGLDVLDIGCGGGLLSEPLCRLGARVLGIDALDESIRVARLHAEQQGLEIDYRCVLPEEFAAEGRRFDLVLNMEVVEHVAERGAFLEACCRLIGDGGAMAVSTINRTLRSLAFAKIGAEYVLRWLPAGTHDWRKFVKPSELARGLEPFGVELVDLRGLTFRPLAGEWALSDDLDVNYLAFAVRREGSDAPR